MSKIKKLKNELNFIEDNIQVDNAGYADMAQIDEGNLVSLNKIEGKLNTAIDRISQYLE